MLASVEKRRQRLGLSPFAIDLLLSVAIAVAMTLTIGVAEEDDATRAPGLFAYSLGFTLAALLLGRRRWPLLVLVGSIGVLMIYYALDYPAFSPAVPLAVAVYSAAVAGRSVPAVVAIAGLLLVGSAWRVVEEGTSALSVLGQGALTDAGLFAALILLGEAVRHRRAWAREVRDRLARSKREQQEETDRRIQEERLRMARELHDVTAHTVAALNVHAAVAADALEVEPERARHSLATIRAQGRDAMAELQAAIALMREEGESEAGDRDPTPRLARVDELVKTASAAGARVEVVTVGQERTLPAAIDLTAYRIVQESLTNVVRHAGAQFAEVRIGYGSDALTVEVVNEGRRTGDPTVSAGGAAPPVAATDGPHRNGPGGHGLLGMHERATTLNGSFEAGPLRGGGFRVYAWLPLEQSL